MGNPAPPNSGVLPCPRAYPVENPAVDPVFPLSPVSLATLLLSVFLILEGLGRGAQLKSLLTAALLTLTTPWEVARG